LGKKWIENEFSSKKTNNPIFATAPIAKFWDFETACCLMKQMTRRLFFSKKLGRTTYCLPH
jgi:hypothetical protein